MPETRDPSLILPLVELGKILPIPKSASTMDRWRTRGVQSRTGRMVTLRCVWLPTGWGSSLNLYDEFIADLQK
jgi:hypothetical protein